MNAKNATFAACPLRSSSLAARSALFVVVVICAMPTVRCRLLASPNATVTASDQVRPDRLAHPDRSALHQADQRGFHGEQRRNIAFQRSAASKQCVDAMQRRLRRRLPR